MVIGCIWYCSAVSMNFMLSEGNNMKKHLSLVLFVIFCMLNACSDDDSHKGSEPTPIPVPDGSCTSDTYIATCPTATTYTACVDGVVVIWNCPADQICENGVCSTVIMDVMPKETNVLQFILMKGRRAAKSMANLNAPTKTLC